MRAADLNARATNQPVPAAATPQALAGLACLISSFILSLLVFVAFQPLLPRPELDASWSYAMDAASSLNLAFGRAVVFTFGPFVSLYTDFRVPEHDMFYLIFETILLLGILSAFALVVHRRRRVYLLLLPFFLANLLVKDAIFFVTPFALVAACSRRTVPHRLWGWAIVLVAVALGLLPLIKGTTLVPVSLCVAIASFILLRDRSSWTVGLPALVAASLLAAWTASGQQLGDLPAYFLGQFYLTSGYTDAMSIFGDSWVIYVYLGATTALFGLMISLSGRHRFSTGIAFLAVAFVAFKAGFVRQDGHDVIAASTLALLGYVVFLQNANRAAFLSLVLGLGGWAVVTGHYGPVGLGEDWTRFAMRVENSAMAIATRITAPDRLFVSYLAAKKRIRDDAGFSREGGAADIYPFDLSLLLASDFDWSPRPVLQSYSAFMPELTLMNARHLERENAPSTLYFAISPIDNRYPNLDDGASWPAILSRYDFISFSGRFVDLGKSHSDHTAVIGKPFLKNDLPFDTDIMIPPDMHDVWATFRFRPTLSGRLLSLLFKLPILTMDVIYRDGRASQTRMIAGIAAGGFLLSPTIDSARDFIGLKSGDPDYLVTSEVKSFRLHQDSSIPFWGTQVGVELAPLTLVRDHSADHELYGTLDPGEPFSGLRVGGDCVIDLLGGRTLDEGAMTLSASSALIQGWAMLSVGAKLANRGVRVALTDEAGNTVYSRADRIERPDVDAYLHLLPPAHVGYVASLDLRGLHGAYTVRVVQDGPDGPVACPTQMAHIVHE